MMAGRHGDSEMEPLFEGGRAGRRDVLCVDRVSMAY